MEQKAKNIEGILIVLLFLAIFLLMTTGLGSTYLTNWDEAWYADMTRNLAMGGNPLTLVFNQQPFFDKPPLYIWSSALLFKLFGPSELVARIPSALSGVGVGLVLYFLAHTLFNRTIAFTSVLILISTIGFLYRARTGNLDTLLTFWLLLSILAFYKAYMYKSSRWFMLMGFATGFAFLTKGIIAFAFPVLAIVFLWIRKDYIVTKRTLLFAIMPAMIISLLWIMLSYIANGEEFIRAFFLNQTEKIAWKGFSPDYFWFLKSGLKLWFILFVPLSLFILFQWRKGKEVLLLLYLFLPLVFLSFSENKSNWFLLPFYPVISLVIADGLYRLTKKIYWRKFSFLLVGAVGLIAVIQMILYRSEYVVADIAGDEARVALVAKDFTQKGDILYLTNYYYPTTVYYSQRKVYAVYSDREGDDPWWIREKNDWKEILRESNIMIITTNEELQVLQESFPKYIFEVLYTSGNKLLVRKS